MKAVIIGFVSFFVLLILSFVLYFLHFPIIKAYIKLQDYYFVKNNSLPTNFSFEDIQSSKNNSPESFYVQEKINGECSGFSLDPSCNFPRIIETTKSPNNTDIAYKIRYSDGKERFVIDNKASRIVGDRSPSDGLSAIVEANQHIYFNLDGTKVVYVTIKQGKAAVVENENIGKYYDSVGNPQFSPDGNILAYVAKENGSEFLVVNGIEGKKYDSVYFGTRFDNLAFSPDSRTFIYVGTKGNESFLVEDRDGLITESESFNKGYYIDQLNLLSNNEFVYEMGYIKDKFYITYVPDVGDAKGMLLDKAVDKQIVYGGKNNQIRFGYIETYKKENGGAVNPNVCLSITNRITNSAVEQAICSYYLSVPYFSNDGKYAFLVKSDGSVFHSLVIIDLTKYQESAESQVVISLFAGMGKFYDTTIRECA